MKISTFAIGIVAGSVIGAAVAVGAESMISPSTKRDLRHYAHKGMRAVSAFMK